MIAYVEGTLLSREVGEVVIRAGGVGYLVHVHGGMEEKLPLSGEFVELHIFTVVREDALDLYGFLEQKERELFGTLLGISGIGPRMAMAILATCSLNMLTDIVASGDAKSLCIVPGIGLKTAKRLLLELATPLGKLTSTTVASAASPMGGGWADASAALQSLGFPKVRGDSVLAQLRKEGHPADVSELVRSALQRLRNDIP